MVSRESTVDVSNGEAGAALLYLESRVSWPFKQGEPGSSAQGSSLFLFDQHTTSRSAVTTASTSMKVRCIGGTAATAVVLFLFSFRSCVVDSISINATHLAKRIAGDEITIASARLVAASPKQAGLFTKPKRPNGIGLTSGVVLSSAWATEELGVNDNKYSPLSDDLQGEGHDELGLSSDACTLEIEFYCPPTIAGKKRVSFEFVYGTDEYPWTGARRDIRDRMMAKVELADFDDDFYYRFHEYIVDLYGRTLTLYPESWATQTSIAPFKDNMSGWYQTEMNGFTKPITVFSPPLYYGSSMTRYKLTIVVADTGLATNQTLDRKNGAWLFIRAGSLTCTLGDPTPDDDFWLYYGIPYFDENELLPSSSPYPSLSPTPMPTPEDPRSPRPTPLDPHTLWPTPDFTRVSDSPEECAEEVVSNCPRCGDSTCYKKFTAQCNIDEKLNTPQSYRRKVSRIIKRRYCI